MYEYDLKRMKDLLYNFYTLTGIKACIYDSDQNELCYYPEKLSTFCSTLRKNPDMDKKCAECDKRAFSVCKRTHKQYAYKCHAGLWECFSPVLYHDNIIGYIVIGQIRAEDAATLPTYLTKELSERYTLLPVIAKKTVSAAFRILDACAGYAYLKALIKSTDNRIETKIEKYIEENLTKDLSVSTLCSIFHLSRSEIYIIFHKYFNSSVADYIKKRRLEKACELLKTTKMPVHKIAKHCGIPDYNYFSKIFKREFGKAPSKFKEFNKNNP